MELSLPRDTEGIRYSLCESSDVQEFIGLISRTFAANDPPAVAVGLTSAELEAYVATLAATAAEDRLTIVARDVASGELAGALLTLDAAADPELVDLPSKFEPIMELFEQLYQLLDTSGSPPQGEALNLSMLAVADDFARHGIAQELVRTCLANGAQRRYRRALTTATNPVSQQIFRKLGFTTLATASYADYRRNDLAVFASIADQGGPMAMAREIDGFGQDDVYVHRGTDADLSEP